MGIQKKNLREVHGQTLLARAIQTCRRAQLVHTVYVSTEDAEIAAEAARWGAHVINRPSWLATATAPTTKVLLHAIDAIDPRPSLLALVQCTAPLLRPAEVDGCIRRLMDTRAEVAVAAVPYHGLVCSQGYRGRIIGVNWDHRQPVPRRQDMLRQWQIAGSVWAIDVEPFVSRQSLYGENCVVYQVDRALDIDEPDDLATAHALCPAANQYLMA